MNQACLKVSCRIITGIKAICSYRIFFHYLGSYSITFSVTSFRGKTDICFIYPFGMMRPLKCDQFYTIPLKCEWHKLLCYDIVIYDIYFSVT